jgi:hypothetical protein
VNPLTGRTGEICEGAAGAIGLFFTTASLEIRNVVRSNREPDLNWPVPVDAP